MAEGIITRRGGGTSTKSNIPEYSYTGRSIIDYTGPDPTKSEQALWLETSGTISFKRNVYADIYLVGGGGGGGAGAGSGGGGGGYTCLKENIFIPAKHNFYINIGQGGKASTNTSCQGDYGNVTTAFGFFANGGFGGGSNQAKNSAKQFQGGSGGSGGGTGTGDKDLIGGKGGSNGSAGYMNSTAVNFVSQTFSTNAIGQGYSTHLFNNSDNFLTSYGGMGGSVTAKYNKEISNYYTNGDYTHSAYGSGGSGFTNIVKGAYGTNSSTNSIFYPTNGQNGVVVIKFKKSKDFPILPEFKYDNAYILDFSKDTGWEAKFLTSGTLIPNQNMSIDAFLVGGGGAGGSNRGGGGGGGYTLTGRQIQLIENQEYPIVIGAGGAAPTETTADVYANVPNSHGSFGNITSAFNLKAQGGYGGTALSSSLGGSGGSGGGTGSSGAADGSNGFSNGSGVVGTSALSARGQGFTTKAFKEENNEMYAGGGGGGSSFQAKDSSTIRYGTFGADGFGGGRGGLAQSMGQNGIDSYGGGGGGGGPNNLGGRGGSGTVIIRNSILEPTFALREDSSIEHYYKNHNTITFLNNGIFSVDEGMIVDAFLVGGGGGGGAKGFGGGGGGYTYTMTGIPLFPHTEYYVNIGSGGPVGYNGSATSFTPNLIDNTSITYNWNFYANGGLSTSTTTGGAGGSGGGDGSTAVKNYPGYGGFDGSNGYQSSQATTFSTSQGQGFSTRPFGEVNQEFYAGGGSGGSQTEAKGVGGLGGGGSSQFKDGLPNTGGGGAGGDNTGEGGSGGSGIVILRKHSIPLLNFEYVKNIKNRLITIVDENGQTIIEEDTENIFLEGVGDWWGETGSTKLLTSGYFKCPNDGNIEVDICLVGGGGAGGKSTSYGNPGGGGGYVENIFKVALEPNGLYEVTIGDGGNYDLIDDVANDGHGGASIFRLHGILGQQNEDGSYHIMPANNPISFSANGGAASTTDVGGAGGSGGGAGTSSESAAGIAGGTNGNRARAVDAENLAQRTTTAAFRDPTQRIYGAGGGGGGKSSGTGGNYGGGNGAANTGKKVATAGAANTGGGGGGSYGKSGAVSTPGNGGSGTILIRKSTNNFSTEYFTYTTENPLIKVDSNPPEGEEVIESVELLNEELDNLYCFDQYGLRILNSGYFQPKEPLELEVFLVGGGGAGAAGAATAGKVSWAGGGGGGGYVKTVMLSFDAEDNTIYEFQIGEGGKGQLNCIGTNGGATKILKHTLNPEAETEEDKFIIEELISVDGGFAAGTLGILPHNIGTGKANADGGDGGSGGGAGAADIGVIGGIDGNNGNNATSFTGTYINGKGANVTTRAFGEKNGEIFATGGSGGECISAGYGAGAGGLDAKNGQHALPNTGAGGGGAGSDSVNKTGGDGGSGVIILRLPKEE